LGWPKPRRAKQRRFSAETSFPSVENLQALLGGGKSQASRHERDRSANGGVAPAVPLTVRRCASVPSFATAATTTTAGRAGSDIEGATAAGRPMGVLGYARSDVAETLGDRQTWAQEQVTTGTSCAGAGVVRRDDCARAVEQLQEQPLAPWEAYRIWAKCNPSALNHECKSYLNYVLAQHANDISRSGKDSAAIPGRTLVG